MGAISVTNTGYMSTAAPSHQSTIDDEDNDDFSKKGSGQLAKRCAYFAGGCRRELIKIMKLLKRAWAIRLQGVLAVAL